MLWNYAEKEVTSKAAGCPNYSSPKESGLDYYRRFLKESQQQNTVSTDRSALRDSGVEVPWDKSS